MNALVIGGGGREHALVWRLAQSDSIERVYCTPGNAGIAFDASCISGEVNSPAKMAALAQTLGVDFTVVGPEAPLVAGVADEFRSRGMPIVGPGSTNAQLEGSKVYCKEFFQANSIPTAQSATVETIDELDAVLAKFGFPVALKADGLAAGKGVVIVQDEAEGKKVGRDMLAGEMVGTAGRRLLVEEFLTGRELSFIILTDGERVFEFRPTQDHKAALDGDKGPNTGGMGAYCDDSIMAPELRNEILDRVIEPSLAALRNSGNPFQGFLYAGLMITDAGPKVLEYNVRMGDPETQPLLYRMTGDFGELLYSAARGQLDPTAVGWRDGATCCVVMASAGYPGSYEKGKVIEGVPEADATGAKVFHAGALLRDGKLVTSGGRVLGVTAAGENLKGAIDQAYAGVSKISFEGAQYRSDIGAKGLA